MAHGWKWNIQICCPEVDMSTRGRRWHFNQGITYLSVPRASVLHLFVVWPTTSKYKIPMNHIYTFYLITSGYTTTVRGRGCNPYRCTTTFANVEITSLWRHWWRHNSETIRDREKRRPPRAMKSSELSNGENLIALRQLLQKPEITSFMTS